MYLDVLFSCINCVKFSVYISGYTVRGSQLLWVRGVVLFGSRATQYLGVYLGHPFINTETFSSRLWVGIWELGEGLKTFPFQPSRLEIFRTKGQGPILGSCAIRRMGGYNHNARNEYYWSFCQSLSCMRRPFASLVCCKLPLQCRWVMSNEWDNSGSMIQLATNTKRPAPCWTNNFDVRLDTETKPKWHLHHDDSMFFSSFKVLCEFCLSFQAP
jgi:hypothetical protein